MSRHLIGANKSLLRQVTRASGPSYTVTDHGRARTSGITTVSVSSAADILTGDLIFLAMSSLNDQTQSSHTIGGASETFTSRISKLHTSFTNRLTVSSFWATSDIAGATAFQITTGSTQAKTARLISVRGTQVGGTFVPGTPISSAVAAITAAVTPAAAGDFVIFFHDNRDGANDAGFTFDGQFVGTGLEPAGSAFNQLAFGHLIAPSTSAISITNTNGSTARNQNMGGLAIPGA